MSGEGSIGLFGAGSEAKRLREEARHCRWMATTIAKPDTSDLLLKMAEEYEGRAATLEREVAAQTKMTSG